MKVDSKPFRKYFTQVLLTPKKLEIVVSPRFLVEKKKR